LKLREQKSAEFEPIPLPMLNSQPDRLHTPMRPTLKLGITSKRSHIGWLKQVIATLENLPEP
jgi:hypothetical protein